MRISKVLTEYRERPIGLDTYHPRFSWIVEDLRRGACQQAYCIQVSKDPGMCALVWDSGRVASDTSNLIEYDGKALEPCTRYYIRVSVWNDAGEVATADSVFETAIMEPSQWQAQWITPDYDFQAPKTAVPVLR